jgi:hypothetical protein
LVLSDVKRIGKVVYYAGQLKGKDQTKKNALAIQA